VSGPAGDQIDFQAVKGWLGVVLWVWLLSLGLQLALAGLIVVAVQARRLAGPETAGSTLWLVLGLGAVLIGVGASGLFLRHGRRRGRRLRDFFHVPTGG
jgi:hypothetical protein